MRSERTLGYSRLIWVVGQSMLELSDIHAGYGKIPVLHGVSLCVPPKTVVTLLGANGAGKTTTLRSIAGLIPLRRGQIVFNGRLLAGFRPDLIVRQGISMVPEGRELFPDMTVAQNLRLGAFTRARSRELDGDLDKVFELFPRLRERYRQAAGTLSGGEQQMLTVARALMARPQLLLFDEPSLGLAPRIVEEIFAIVPRIKSNGTSVLLVEQNARMALAVTDYGYVMEMGEIRIQGSARELETNPGVQRAYLRT
jgi:branched-chain amino acid transport system ATP-binding protein